MFLRFYVNTKLALRVFKRSQQTKVQEGSVIIVSATNENYAMPLEAMIASLLNNFKSYKKIEVFILESEVSVQTKERIKRHFGDPRINITWIKIDLVDFKDMNITGHITVESYFRLLIPKILPGHIEKVIYLDCDLIVDEDIGKLWDIEIKDNYLLAVPEMHRDSLYASSPCGIKAYKELGIDPSCRLYNSGVLVINVKKWRQDNIANRIMDYLVRYKEHILWNDQDGMNAILAGKYLKLDPRWNLLTQLLYEYNSWKASPLDKNTYKRAVKSPYIIHFNTNSKPWQKGDIHPYKDLFFHYLDMTSWKGWRP
jgi:lipopolysaccharide biosynthesis glycosyltransferase